MKWNIFFRHGQSVAHLYAKNDGPHILQKKWFLPSTNAQKGFNDFLKEHKINDIENIYFSTPMSEHLISKELWEDSAFFVTQGFENWLDMNVPQNNPLFNIQTQRLKTPLKPNLTFGVQERVNSDGKVINELNVEDLELYLPKLQLHNITSVALGFINSRYNSSNLDKAVHFFKENGFKVYFTNQQHYDYFSETDYWHLNILRASSTEVLKEYIEDCFSDTTHLEKVRILASEGFISLESLNLFDSIVSEKKLIFKTAQNQLTNDHDYSIFAGLEKFYCTVNSDQWVHLNTKWGPLPIDQPQIFPLDHQPTQELSQNIWSLPQFDFVNTQYQQYAKCLGYEPGPISLGKGLRLTLIDLLYLYDENFKSFLPFKPGRKSQIYESLASLSYRTEKIDLMTLVESLLEIFTKNMVMELKLHNSYNRNSQKALTNIELWGPLSETLYKVFNKFYKSNDLQFNLKGNIDVQPFKCGDFHA